MKKLIPLLLLCAVVNINAQSDSLTGPEFYLGANYLSNSYISSFGALPGVPSCCPEYTKGDATGYGFTAGAGWRFNRWIGVQLGLGYFGTSGKFESLEPELVSWYNNPAEGKFKHILEHDLSAFELSPSLYCDLWIGFRISVGIGGALVLGSDFSQREEIVTPYNSVFMDTKTPVRNDSAGQVESQTAMLLSARGALEYFLPVSADKSWNLVPFVSYDYGLSDMTSETEWKTNSFRAGLKLSWAPRPEPRPPLPPLVLPAMPEPPIEEPIAEEVAPVEEPEPAEDAPALINASLSYDLPGAGKGNGLELEEFLTVTMQPLLSYIFFNDNESEIPDRYIKLNANQANRKKLRDLCSMDLLQTYANILNILGLRMIESPESKIFVTGCNSADNLEKNNLKLSQARAEEVKAYLVSTWGIEPSRIITGARGLPPTPSRGDNEDGIAENRRVEIKSQGNDLLMPVVFADTTLQSDNSSLTLLPACSPDSLVKHCEILFGSGSGSKKLFSGSKAPKSYTVELNSFLDLRRIETDSLEFTLLINRDDSLETEASVKIPFRRKSIERKQMNMEEDKLIDKYSLILFDFNSSSVLGNNMDIINVIKSKLKPSSVVNIIGRSDRVGDDDYNYELALKRAKNTYNKLGIPSAAYISKGETELLYDNDLPEGRFYSRTVSIIVETAVERSNQEGDE